MVCFTSGGTRAFDYGWQIGNTQVLCPGGAEHLGIFVEPNQIPPEWLDHQYVFHSPVIFVPRLNAEEIQRVAANICDRLQHTTHKAYFMIPKGGVGRYSKVGGVLYDPASDAAFFDYLKTHLPPNIQVVEKDLYVEDPAFVKEGADLLIGLIEEKYKIGF